MRQEQSGVALLFMMIYFSADTLLFGTNANLLVTSYGRYIQILLILVLFVKAKSEILKKKNLIMTTSFVLLLVTFLLVSFINSDRIPVIFAKAFPMFMAFLYCLIYSFESFSESFRKVVYYLSICALFHGALSLLLPSVVRMMPAVVNISDYLYYTFYLSSSFSETTGMISNRLQSIFWEPGVFQMYINLAILLELFSGHGINRKRLLVYIIALVFTFSTTGFIVFAWIMLMHLVIRQGSKHVGKFIVASCLMLSAAFIISHSFVGEMVFGKLTDETNENYGSTTVRAVSVLTNIEIAADNPIHGIGMDRMEDEFLQRSMITKQNTSTLFYQFSAFGVFFGCLYMLGVILFGRCVSRRFSLRFCVFVMFFLLYLGENLQYSVYPLLTVFYGYDSLSNNYLKFNNINVS